MTGTGPSGNSAVLRTRVSAASASTPRFTLFNVYAFRRSSSPERLDPCTRRCSSGSTRPRPALPHSYFLILSRDRTPEDAIRRELAGLLQGENHEDPRSLFLFFFLRAARGIAGDWMTPSDGRTCPAAHVPSRHPRLSIPTHANYAGTDVLKRYYRRSIFKPKPRLTPTDPRTIHHRPRTGATYPVDPDTDPSPTNTPLKNWRLSLKHTPVALLSGSRSPPSPSAAVNSSVRTAIARQTSAKPHPRPSMDSRRPPVILPSSKK